MNDPTQSDLEKLLERMREERESGPAFPMLPFTVPPNGGKIHQQLADAGSVGHGGACVGDAASVGEGLGPFPAQR